ncbi:hypothetical protein MMC09_004419 [Bachmanniomyces sp. S44760]|nr:hypothetical protein [Bachmanniomyces sp. S44760]
MPSDYGKFIVSSLPPTPLLLGIDLLSFTLNPKKTIFIGLRGLPSGWHFIWTSPGGGGNGDTGGTTSEGWTALVGGGRSGEWIYFDCKTAEGKDITIRRKWNSEEEALVPIEEDASAESPTRVESTSTNGLLDYNDLADGISNKDFPSPSTALRSSSPDQKSQDWALLTAHITPHRLARFTNTPSPNSESRIYTLTSTSSSQQDQESIPGLTPAEVSSIIGQGVLHNQNQPPGPTGRETKTFEEEPELGFLGIDLSRTWREGAIGRERTEGARDRSWKVGEILDRIGAEEEAVTNDDGEREVEFAEGREKHGKRIVEKKAEKAEKEAKADEKEYGAPLLFQLSISYLTALTLGNHACFEEWKRTTTLLLTCRRLIPHQPQLFITFLNLLSTMLRRATEDVESGGLFDFSGEEGEGEWLKALLKGFRRTLEELEGSDVVVVAAAAAGSDAPTKSKRIGHERRPALEQVRESMRGLEEWVRREFGWELGDDFFVRKGMLALEDGEMVEMEMDELEGEDERGEYAPVVVEL